MELRLDEQVFYRKRATADYRIIVHSIVSTASAMTPVAPQPSTRSRRPMTKRPMIAGRAAISIRSLVCRVDNVILPFRKALWRTGRRTSTPRRRVR